MRVYLFLLLSFIGFSSVHGAYLFKNGRLFNAKYVAALSLEKHYELGIEALKQKNWIEAEDQFRICITSFERAPLASDARYYLGIALYEQGEFDLAHKQFTNYLTANNHAIHLEDVYRYKLSIAQKLSQGHKRRMFGTEGLPKIMGAQTLALEIFDEIASTLPNHELTATALLEKSKLLYRQEDCEQSIETYQTVIRRFKKSYFAISAFNGIADCYKAQLNQQPQNEDALVLAEINLKEFQKQFPQASEIKEIRLKCEQMQEMHVTSLYETGLLYERMNQPKASVLYYHIAITKLPTSAVAALCKQRMKDLSKYVDEVHLSI